MDSEVFQKAKVLERRIENLEKLKVTIASFFAGPAQKQGESFDTYFINSIKKLTDFLETKPDYLKATEAIDQQIEQLKQEFNAL